MRYRKLDANGDYTFGHQQNDLWRDVPEAVGQAAYTRLELRRGEWFVNTAEGTPHLQEILGTNTRLTRDPAIQARILGTQGLLSLDFYSSRLAHTSRILSVQATITTIYGVAKVEGNF